MTDKEVIIDSVNVVGCEYHSSTPSSELCYMKGNKCEDNPNCYYKQLACKTEELQAEKQKVEELENKYIKFETDVINSLNRNILEDWCAEEDEDCPDSSDVISFMDFVIKDYIDNLHTTIDTQETENDCYKQALEEINSIANQINLTIMGGEKSPKEEWIQLYTATVCRILELCQKVLND